MKLQPAVKQETLHIAAGTACLACVMMLIFLILGAFDHTVLLGTLLGYATAVGNFFLMAVTIQRAVESIKPTDAAPIADEDADADEADKPSALSPAAKQRIQFSYTGRMLLIVAVGILALAVDLFHPVATLLCLLFPRIVIFVIGQLTKKKETE